MTTRVRCNRALPLVLACLAPLAGCQGAAEAPPAESAAPAATTAAAPPAAAAAAGRDLAQLDACALLPGEQAAEIVGGTVGRAPSSNLYGAMSSCEYDIKLPGGGLGKYFAIWITAPSLFGDADDSVETARGLGQEATAEAVSGLGDDAYLVLNETEEQAILHVLLSGDVALEIKAPQADQARSLAEAILQRLE
jgi:hypothetical protein